MIGNSVAVAAFAAAMSLSSAVLAADVIEQVPEAPEPVVQDLAAQWTGPYVGIYAAYHWMHSDFSSGDDITGIDGIGAGGYAGYNYQIDPNFVVGLEGAVGFSDAENNFNNTTVEQGWDASLRARLGYAFGESMIYGIGGLAGTNATVSRGSSSDSQTHLGWTIGAGFETFLTENVVGRVEYDYSSYNSQTYEISGSDPDVSLTDHAIKLGVGLKF
jgi:outer membrane immunogenic protein